MQIGKGTKFEKEKEHENTTVCQTVSQPSILPVAQPMDISCVLNFLERTIANAHL